MINVYIISGFLGAGKTTFIKKILESDRLKDVMLLENEFGEVGIDGNLFNESLKLKEINSGCICCSLKGELASAIEEIKTYDISNLIIEPSGVGKLSEVMMTIINDDDLKLKSHICLVDAKKVKIYHKNFKEFFDDQVIGANAIILSKLEDISDDKLSEDIEILKALNDEVEILDKPYLDMSPDYLLDFIEMNTCSCELCDGCHDEDLEEHIHHCLEGDHHHHDHDHEHCHHHHHAEDVFDSFSIKTDRCFTKEELLKILHSLKGIIRCKGIVRRDADTALYFDISGDDISISRYSGSNVGSVVFIGKDLDSDSISKLFL